MPIPFSLALVSLRGVSRFHAAAHMTRPPLLSGVLKARLAAYMIFAACQSAAGLPASLASTPPPALFESAIVTFSYDP